MNTAAAGMVPAIANPNSFMKGRRVPPDPLDPDQPNDEVVGVTRRAMMRVALVATEVASRFQREGVSHDPMAWMLAPRALFGGAAAIEACVERDNCLRGVLLHGLSLGLDAEREAVDALFEEDDVGVEVGTAAIGEAEALTEGNVLPFMPPHRREPRLFTAMVSERDGFEAIQVFHASLANDETEVAGRLFCRIGAASADARIIEGFDPSDPLVMALVSSAICDTLQLIADEPGSSLAAGLDLHIEQRFVV